MKERWKLELLPEKIPQPVDISGTAWSQVNPRSILGRGSDFAIAFPVFSARQLAGPGASRLAESQLQLHFTTIRYPSVNDESSPIVEMIEKYPVTIDGPFVEYGGQIRIFFASTDRLVLDGLVRVGDRKWYRLSSNRVDIVGKLKRDVRIVEHLFEFQNDPLVEEQGDVTVHRHVRQLSQDQGVILHTPWQFTARRRLNEGENYRSVEVLGETITFVDKEGQFAVWGKDSMGGTGVFRKIAIEGQPTVKRNP